MCYKSRGPTVISYWSKNESCVLYRSYPGQLRSFKRPGYLAVRPQKIRFFLATNLGWRSANAISYDLFKRTQEKYCLRCIIMLRNIVSRSCFCGNKIIRTFLSGILRTLYLSITFCETLSLLQNRELKQQRRRRQREAKTQRLRLPSHHSRATFSGAQHGCWCSVSYPGMFRRIFHALSSGLEKNVRLPKLKEGDWLKFGVNDFDLVRKYMRVE